MERWNIWGKGVAFTSTPLEATEATDSNQMIPLLVLPLLLLGAFGLLTAFCYAMGIWIGWLFGPKNEGTIAEMAQDPSLNTNNRKLHFKRLRKYNKSKYCGEWEYMGPRGGIYTITPSGNRNYRY